MTVAVQGPRYVHRFAQARKPVFQQVIVGAGLRGLDGGFGRSMRGHHQDGKPWPRGMEFADQFQPVQTRQFQIGDDDIELFGPGAGQAAVAGLLDRHFIAFIGEHAAQRGHNGGVIFNQQDFGGRIIHGLCKGRMIPKVVPWSVWV